MGPPDERIPSGADPERLWVGRVLGRYRLEERLGQGGFADVLRATRLDDGVAVALKVVRRFRRTARRQRDLLREAALLRDLAHPRLMPCLDVGFADGWTYLAMPYCPGGSLRERVRRDGPLPAAAAVEVCAQVLEALEHMHGRGVVHRDVKPHNVLFDPAGGALLTDLGLALVLDEERGPARRTHAGTAGYRAPEQDRGVPDLDGRADLWGLGITLHLALTGERPADDGALAPSIPPALVTFLATCLAADRAARYSSAAAARGALLTAGPG